jgi:hypothetical protein
MFVADHSQTLEGTMGEAETDRRIENLGSGAPDAADRLVELGEPALRRLLDVFDAKVRVPLGPYMKDAIDRRKLALARLAKDHSDLTWDLVHERTYLDASLGLALRMSGDPRLKSFAELAAKNGGWLKKP